MDLLLWIIAACLVVGGIVQILRGSVLLGIALIIVGCIVGPGGYSIFHQSRSHAHASSRISASTGSASSSVLAASMAAR